MNAFYNKLILCLKFEKWPFWEGIFYIELGNTGYINLKFQADNENVIMFCEKMLRQKI
jgi:hypothetical protein